MIAYLEGRVMEAGVGSIILFVSGVGYRVFTVGFNALSDEDLSLFIYDHIREDRRELYGFKEAGVLHLFERLIDISGVGTKLAQKILSVATHEEISKKILEGDITFLTSISGVGTKTAQKIVLELKGVLVEEGDNLGDQETVEALMSLGYQRGDAVLLAKDLVGDSVEDRVREALKKLGNNF